MESGYSQDTSLSVENSPVWRTDLIWECKRCKERGTGYLLMIDHYRIHAPADKTVPAMAQKIDLQPAVNCPEKSSPILTLE